MIVRCHRLSLLLLGMVILLMPMMDASGESSLFHYEVIGTEVALTGYDNKEAVSICIPGTIEGLPVTEIRAGAFSDCSFLESFTLDDNQQVFTIIDDALAEASTHTLLGGVPPSMDVLSPFQYSRTQRGEGCTVDEWLV